MNEKQRIALMNALRATGVFVTCGIRRSNVMTTHWGCMGTLWNRDVFVLPVRKSKLSYEIIKENGSFAISVPVKDMRNEIALCDHISGHFVNKFEELHLHPKRARKIDAYVLGECGLIVECRVATETELSKDAMLPDLHAEMYDRKDYHSLFIGEVVETYNLR